MEVAVDLILPLLQSPLQVCAFLTFQTNEEISNNTLDDVLSASKIIVLKKLSFITFTDGRTDGRTDRRTDGQTDRQTDWLRDGRTDGRNDWLTDFTGQYGLVV